jgi:hypothetical protein
MTARIALVSEKPQMVALLRTEPSLAQRFLAHMLTRNIRVEEDLMDQLVNSSKKRLARVLLLLARIGPTDGRCGSRRCRRKRSPRSSAPRVRGSTSS